MINNFLVITLLSMCFSLSLTAEEKTISPIEKIVLWEKKINDHFAGGVVRFPTRTHEFERRIIFFDETKKIIEDKKNSSKYRIILGERIMKPSKPLGECRYYYGFLYCILAGVDYKKLLIDHQSSSISLNSVVRDVLILSDSKGNITWQYVEKR